MLGASPLARRSGLSQRGRTKRSVRASFGFGRGRTRSRGSSSRVGSGSSGLGFAVVRFLELRLGFVQDRFGSVCVEFGEQRRENIEHNGLALFGAGREFLVFGATQLLGRSQLTAQPQSKSETGEGTGRKPNVRFALSFEFFLLLRRELPFALG